jgi:hypothetical membrane protein
MQQKLADEKIFNKHGNIRMFLLGGILGPAVFSLVTFISAMLRPGYSHLNNTISELGATGTEYANFMNYSGFIPTGLMFALFGVAFTKVLPTGRFVLAAGVLITLFGFGMSAAGVFSCDAGWPQAGGSVEQSIHDAIGPIMFLCIILAAAILGFYFRSTSIFQHLGTYSIFTSISALAFMFALMSSIETRTLSGLWQRLMIADVFLWCGIMGWKTYQGTHAMNSHSLANHSP